MLWNNIKTVQRTVFLFLLICTCSLLPAQKVIELRNPSFEDRPGMGSVPSGWKDCGFPGESPPDIQPCNAFAVTAAPVDGATYLGMVTRDNDTWEKVGARLSSRMEAGVVYEFHIQLCRSAEYQSFSRLTNQPADFIRPVVLRIYGGNGHCEKEQLLGISPPVDHINWAAYRFTLSPKDSYSHLLLEAYYVDARGEAYCGNLLVDAASALKPLGPSATIDRASVLGERVEE